MTPEEIAEKEAATAAAKAAAEQAEADSQRKAKEESERKKRSEAEKAAYTLRKNAERLKALGGDPRAILESDDNDNLDDDDDNRPLTRGDLKRIEQEKAQKTAEAMAEDIEDEKERNLVKEALTSSIKPSGNPALDLANARAIVNAEKNRQIAEEAERGRSPRRNGSGTGSPSGKGGDDFVPTADEAKFMKAPYNMTKEKILAVRKKEAEGRR